MRIPFRRPGTVAISSANSAVSIHPRRRTSGVPTAVLRHDQPGSYPPAPDRRHVHDHVEFRAANRTHSATIQFNSSPSVGTSMFRYINVGAQRRTYTDSDSLTFSNVPVGGPIRRSKFTSAARRACITPDEQFGWLTVGSAGLPQPAALCGLLNVYVNRTLTAGTLRAITFFEHRRHTSCLSHGGGGGSTGGSREPATMAFSALGLRDNDAVAERLWHTRRISRHRTTTTAGTADPESVLWLTRADSVRQRALGANTTMVDTLSSSSDRRRAGVVNVTAGRGLSASPGTLSSRRRVGGTTVSDRTG